jgi:hypothetical protein
MLSVREWLASLGLSTMRCLADGGQAAEGEFVRSRDPVEMSASYQEGGRIRRAEHRRRFFKRRPQPGI